MNMKDHKIAGTELEYLCVDDFLRNLVDAAALTTAFQSGLIDQLIERQPCVLASLGEHVHVDDRGLRLLLDLLRTNDVVCEGEEGVGLTEHFTRALQYRDLLEAKLDIARLAGRDVIDHFDDLVMDTGAFMGKASLFRLFSYGRCFTPTPENRALTRRWMRFTSALTRYEAPVLLKHHDVSRYRRMLDIGGNSGEFALQVCRRHPGIEAIVYDLPLVCEIGREHVCRQPEAGRISFISGNALVDRLPRGFDLITFKSVLHDWPEREAREFLTRAVDSLEEGGTLLIFEREPLETGKRPISYAMVPLLLFSHSFRSPDLYIEHLGMLGLTDIRSSTIDLETPFCLVSSVMKKK